MTITTMVIKAVTTTPARRAVPGAGRGPAVTGVGPITGEERR